MTSYALIDFGADSGLDLVIDEDLTVRGRTSEFGSKVHDGAEAVYCDLFPKPIKPRVAYPCEMPIPKPRSWSGFASWT